jgi:hypothetical protein
MGGLFRLGWVERGNTGISPLRCAMKLRGFGRDDVLVVLCFGRDG